MVKPVVGLLAVALTVSACASSGTTLSHMRGTVPSTPADVAIARVQTAERGGFGMFPQGETRSGCQIPAGLRPLHGTCESRVDFRKNGVAVVTFTEFWPAAKFRTRASARGTLHHSWSFEIRRNGRIVSAGDSGAFPPQAAD